MSNPASPIIGRFADIPVSLPDSILHRIVASMINDLLGDPLDDPRSGLTGTGLIPFIEKERETRSIHSHSDFISQYTEFVGATLTTCQHTRQLVYRRSLSSL